MHSSVSSPPPSALIEISSPAAAPIPCLVLPPRFYGTVRLRLRPSINAFWWILLSHGAGVLGLCFLSCPRWCGELLLLVLTFSLIHGLRHEVWRCARQSIVRVDVGYEGSICVIRRSGRRECGRVLPGSLVTHTLVLLRWRHERHILARHCWLIREACDSRSHWLLRVLLRHPL